MTKLEIDISTTAQDYGMFSDLGNAAVHAVVTAAQANNLNWAQTYRALCALAEQMEFGEATDTEVRERVYDTLQFWHKGQDFYI